MRFIFDKNLFDFGDFSYKIKTVILMDSTRKPFEDIQSGKDSSQYGSVYTPATNVNATTQNSRMLLSSGAERRKNAVHFESKAFSNVN